MRSTKVKVVFSKGNQISFFLSASLFLFLTLREGLRSLPILMERNRSEKRGRMSLCLSRTVHVCREEGEKKRTYRLEEKSLEKRRGEEQLSIAELF